ncbi:DcaP family trimeric outer membrane transporter [Xanthomonas campestris pv. plantaginis]|uniref:DcaP family trimeric outer membrane transporter n=1 Tax=Xanthomonas campestris TaxID=339 RepID=UPI002B22973D|nr:DcaP family trimeric outer membrane transporter [Xanthomonas campestris]MEA9608467.1 DcaP family trimeric outer membrane transporter [Xanthomonas campestris pv. plantaginis]
MKHRKAPLVRKPLAAALFVATILPGVAFAQNSKEKALEARIADLERQVQMLVSAQQQQQGQITQTQTQVGEVRAAQAQAPAAPALPAGKRPIQLTSITPNAAAGTTFRYGGFIKADFMTTRTSDGALPEGAVGRYLYIPTQTPVGGQASSTDTDFHAKFSRFNLGVDTVTENGDKLTGFIELDFFGNALANQVNNLYGGTLRHAYMSWNNWLAGQTWSNFVDATILPEAADIVGPTDGALFSRQTQIRYTRGAFSVSAENPETLTTPYQGGNTILASDHGAMPDLTARYNWKGTWGTFGLSAIARQYRTRSALTNDTDFGGAIAGGGRWIINANNDLRYQLSYGEGLGRYLGLGNGSDVEIDIDGKIQTVSTLAGWVAWRHDYNAKLRSTIMYSRVNYDHDIANTGALASKSQQSIRANVFYSPLPKVDVGAELMYGRREAENGDSGDISRLQFTTKYSF